MTKKITELSQEEQDECERVRKRITDARKKGGQKAAEKQFITEVHNILKF